MSLDRLELGRIVTVFGGSGFVGRHVVRALAREGWRVRIACRRPDLAFFLQPLGGPGQVMPVQANLRNPELGRRGASRCGRGRKSRRHFGRERIAEICDRAGAGRARRG